MVMSTIGIVASVAAVLFIGIWIGFPKVGKDNMPRALWVLGIIAVVGGLISFGVGSEFTGLSVAGGTTTVDSGAGPKLAIATATFQTEDSLSGSRTAVAEVLQIYKADVDPKDPLAGPVASATFASGVASINNTLKTNTPYRVIVDGSVGTYYSEDFGIISFDDDNLEVQSGLMVIDLSELKNVEGKAPFVNIATMTDLIDETTNSTKLNGGNWGNVEAGNETGEILSATADTIFYDESVGDGQFYMDLTFEASGSNEALIGESVCIEFDATNPPEGNEVSALTMALRTGTDRGIPSDIIDFWSNEECFSLTPDPTTAGTSSEYRLTVSVNEANLDTTDEWRLYHDDLGGKNKKDIGLNTGVAVDQIKFDAVA